MCLNLKFIYCTVYITTIQFTDNFGLHAVYDCANAIVHTIMENQLLLFFRKDNLMF